MKKTTMSRLLYSFLQTPFRLISLIIVSIVHVSLAVYLPVLIGEAVDFIGQKNNTQTLISLLFSMLFVIIAHSLFLWFSGLIAQKMVFQYGKNLKNELMARLHQLPIPVFDNYTTGDLISRATTDIEQLTNGLLLVFEQFLTGLLTLIFLIFSMANLDGVMLAMVLFLTPLTLLVANFIGKRSYHFYEKQLMARKKESQLIEEVVRQKSLIQLFNAKEKFLNLFDKRIEDYTLASQKATFYSSTVNPVTRFLNSLIYALLIGVGALRILHGFLSLGQLVTFLNYAKQYSKPFNDISSVLSELQGALACAERLYELIDAKNDIETSENQSNKTLNLKEKITFENINFSYQKGHRVLKDISFSINPGETVAIVGPTGSGKTTLINLLMRFYSPDSGSILFGDTAIQALDKKEFYQKIGMVAQTTWLKKASVFDNISYAYPNSDKLSVEKAAKLANADHFIQQLPDGYDTLLDESQTSLSEGQRQLISIARVFLKAPELLILDEATSSIDANTEVLVQNALQKLMAGKTSIIIAHRLSTIMKADNIIVLKDGRLVESGNHQELMTRKGLYYEMYQSH
ncbi:ABC transporter ATP-binding protein [Streptococcus pacificus]|uniref:ABC transporter ATP-binding protein n=1 Tax=Streptococcus pacificus TaxID=2740577 RepID=A0ABS0ZHM9_9STRE|nr:ABC transporter ATP-binding protein [Streptococcus pacificus]MBJ8325511.1 ABC transporter ATP-binding protein [Streptococcus pacificus]